MTVLIGCLIGGMGVAAGFVLGLLASRAANDEPFEPWDGGF